MSFSAQRLFHRTVCLGPCNPLVICYISAHINLHLLLLSENESTQSFALLLHFLNVLSTTFFSHLLCNLNLTSSSSQSLSQTTTLIFCAFGSSLAISCRHSLTSTRSDKNLEKFTINSKVDSYPIGLGTPGYECTTENSVKNTIFIY